MNSSSIDVSCLVALLLVALETEGMILLIPGLSSDVNHVTI